MKDTQLETNIRTYSNNESLVKERRQHIIACAINVFLKKGYKGTTMRELARACAMSEGSLYRYIGSKDDILHLICTARARGVERLEGFFHELGAASPTEALEACINTCFMWAESSRDYNLFFNREISHFSSEDRHTLLGDQVAMVHFFEKRLIDGIEAGEFEMESPLLVAHDILIKTHDWGMRRWFLKQYVTLEEYAGIHTRLILRSIRVEADYDAVHKQDSANR